MLTFGEILGLNEMKFPPSGYMKKEYIMTAKKTISKNINEEESKAKLRIKAKDPKVEATKKGEPWVSIIKVELDPENVGNGAFELDWNDFFITKLLRAGYQGKDDAQIVDGWFQDVCRNVVLETFEQFEANNPRPITGVKRRDIGDGRSEVS